MDATTTVNGAINVLAERDGEEDGGDERDIEMKEEEEEDKQKGNAERDTERVNRELTAGEEPADGEQISSDRESESAPPRDRSQHS